MSQNEHVLVAYAVEVIRNDYDFIAVIMNLFYVNALP